MPGMATRQSSIKFDVGGPDLVLHRFDAIERLSEPFVIHAQVGCPKDADFYPHLGKTLTLAVNSATGENLRSFNAHLTEVDFVGKQNDQFVYQFTLRPWVYYLIGNSDYNVYQDLTVVEIIKKLLDSRSRGQVAYNKLSVQRAKRTYCVQYGESDFRFISRLMEEEGIYYFFDHKGGEHTMVLCDGRQSHPKSAYANLPYVPPGGGAQTYTDRVTAWNERVGSSGELKTALWTWEFSAPKVQKESFSVSDPKGPTPGDKTERFIMPSPGFIDIVAGANAEKDSQTLQTTATQTVLNAARRETRLMLGEADAPKLACGTILTLSGHTVSRLNLDYLVVGLRYSVEGQAYRSGSGGEGSSSVVIEAVPADVPWRAPQRTPKPVARGPETAIVVGPSGEKIYTDKHGRVKVQFHWDRTGKNDDKSSCWIRVSNGSADADFGHLVLPRVGQEVIIDYLHGDPDRPIVTGRVYNGDHKHAETLPDQRTRSTWRSRTVGDYEKKYDNAEEANPGVGFNLIGMEDKAGSELLRMWASRDMWKTVWRDDRTLVNRDQTVNVRHDRTTNVLHNETKTVEKGDESHTVQTGKRFTSIQQNEELTVVQGNMVTTVSTGNQNNEVSTGNQSNKVSTGNKTVEVSMGNMKTTLGVGNYSLGCDLGAISMEAMQKIELKVGANSIVIDQMGVTINGIMVKAQGQAMLQAKAPLTQINGDALTMVKGGIVMIN